MTVGLARLGAAKGSQHVAHLRERGARVRFHAVERGGCLGRARVSRRARGLYDQCAHALDKPLHDVGVEPVAFLEPGGAHLCCPLLGAHGRESSQLAHLVAARGHQRTAQRRTADEHGEEEQVVGDGVGAGSATWLARVSRQASTADPSAAGTGRSQAPAAKPAATATRTVTGVSMRFVPTTTSRRGPQAVTASNVTAASGRRATLTSGMGRG